MWFFYDLPPLTGIIAACPLARADNQRKIGEDTADSRARRPSNAGLSGGLGLLSPPQRLRDDAEHAQGLNTTRPNPTARPR